ncbi:hypothetical protein PR048_019149 [Dryococelus australis]|uniref:Uncharacterized protein n=1 Tax=Dryococelus australis TaxID=614101 RepID=A0ABQ9H317_9NEOP|nr:hypothetical protein PR048_019149 [Dryococelus australis]
MEGKTVNFKLNTGSEVNIIPQRIVRQVANTSQLNQPLTVHKWLQFVVVEDGTCRMPILGLPECICLNLVSCNFVCVYSIYQGDMSEDSLIVGKSVQPVAKPPRRVPLAFRDRLEGKLHELGTLGVIAKVDQPCGWVSNLTVVERSDNSLRLCLDPVKLNKAICREYQMIQTLEELSCQLNVALDEPSSQ